MSGDDFRTPQGFQDLWRPVGRVRAIIRETPRVEGSAPPRPPKKTGAPPPAVADGGGGGRARPGAAAHSPKATLARLAAKAPEVTVKITGRKAGAGKTQAHLEYISRHGRLELEDRDGMKLAGLARVRELANDWSEEHRLDADKRADSPIALSIVLSMPPGTDAERMRDAVREFARETFSRNYDYAFAVHDDTDHPHVHLSVRMLGDDGERLNPRKGDLDAWRRTFAQALRERGIEAEATTRRARGIPRRAEKTSIRKMKDRHAQGRGPMPQTVKAAYKDAAGLASGRDTAARPWETRLRQRQEVTRTAYLGAAAALARSADPADHQLARKVEAFAREMPAPATRRHVYAAELKSALEAKRRELEEPKPVLKPETVIKDPRKTPGRER